MVGFSLSLFSLGFGYYVLLKATEETVHLRTLGNVLGIIIMVGGCVGVAGSFYICYKQCAAGVCPWTASLAGKIS